ncbi:HD domain-containing protein [Pedobacter panaciterrae]|jgi:HD superfamily phosphohydrolases|uniref:HD domain-containing protein n=1 Tax=Pedobacter panaciterrae TaxID=363849 RepID=A0ABU8NN90_9SPHI|nr:HD domain-containing protein [Pedobacter panaciterrae]NQX56312.1 HD domain-containing protein [Pedobacter panaciterrae]
MVLINDIFFDKVEVPGIFDDLINSSWVKRLGRIHQSGAIFLVNPNICHTRLEHSIGVMLLIRHLGGSELEQVAGLLHDISHTAFSHVGDYVFDNTEENYHEQVFEEVLHSSDIPEILSWHGYHIDDIIKGTFNILEQAAPRLCADRLDYTLRDSYHAGLVSRKEVKDFIKHLGVEDGIIVIENAEKAEWINNLYKKLIDDVFNLPLHIYANRKLTELIKVGLQRNELVRSDLLKDDTYLLNKIRSTASGYEGVKAIKQQRGFDVFVKKGMGLKMKNRQLNALI